MMLHLITQCLVIILFLNACATSPTPKHEVENIQRIPQLDYLEIQNRVGIDLAPGQTGYREKTFDACDLGPALHELSEPLSNCHHAYFTLIQFQLSCRTSDEPDTILTEGDLRPLQDKKLKWTLGKTIGQIQTDFQGNGVIRAISGSSKRKSYLRISTGKDFLMMHAGQASAIVTPPAWCGDQR